ncbi:MAG: hypothetical protein JSV80_18240 [Acidobacteriota bacterium]|nr:MAG: hypothetical protein JSV80_18240 [Acidobacteriota bacterium]
MQRDHARLVEQRRQLLALSHRERLARVLGARRPRQLVQSLPAQELYLTVRGLDREEALPLLAHASRHQLEFLIDVDAWVGDDLDPQRLGTWLESFAEAAPDLLVRWLLEADEDAVVLALSRLLHVYKLDPSTDEDFWPPDDRPLATLDNVYFVEGREGIADAALRALWSGLDQLRAERRDVFEALLEQVLWIIPAEREEQAFEQRAKRMAALGFPELDEALEVWAAGPEADPGVRRRRAEQARALPAPDEPGEAGGGRDRPGPPLPALAASIAPALIKQAARRLSDPVRERVAHDLVRLANRFAVAGLGHLGDPSTHAEALRTALSHVNLGLIELSSTASNGVADAAAHERSDSGGDVEDLSARALAGLPIIELNRLGVGAVIERARRAARLATRGWLSRVHLARERLDAELDALLEGLTQPRPTLAQPGVSARAFCTAEDLAVADARLATIEALGELLEQRLDAGRDELRELRAGLAARKGPNDIEWSSVALTSLARRALGEAVRPVPLDEPQAREAIARLLSADATPSPLFFELAAELDLTGAAEFLGRRLSEDAAAVLAGSAADPRYVRALLFAIGS